MVKKKESQKKEMCFLCKKKKDLGLIFPASGDNSIGFCRECVSELGGVRATIAYVVGYKRCLAETKSIRKKD